MAHDMTGRSALVVGLGRFGGGVGVARWLAEQGAKVTVTDQATEEALRESVAALKGLPIRWRLGGHSEDDLAGIDLAVINPAVDKIRSTFYGTLASRHVPWTTELNLFCERCPARVIGITGSYGKSTTCAMLDEVLRHARAVLGPAAGYGQVFLGGNIGRSLLGDLPRMQKADWVVLEVSSAQLEDTRRVGWTPDIAVITNLYPQHLDRHGSFEAYARAKFNILRTSSAQDTQPLIVGPMTAPADAWLAGTRRQGWIHPNKEGSADVRLAVPGEHNRANAAVVLAVVDVLGLPRSVAEDALAAFRGLPHRLELLGHWGPVKVYNDSKSTAPAATLRALMAVEGCVLLIVGGKRKDVDWDELAAEAVRRCGHVICMGEAGPEVAGRFRSAARGLASAAGIHHVADVPAAVRRAAELSSDADAVLFSPGAQSFDAYRNYVERGLHFSALAMEVGLSPTAGVEATVTAT